MLVLRKLIHNSPSPASSATGTPTPTPTVVSKTSKGRIAGIVVGVVIGTLVLVLVIIGVFMWLRRRRQRVAIVSIPNSPSEYAEPIQDDAMVQTPFLQPFMATTPTSLPSSKAALFITTPPLSGQPPLGTPSSSATVPTREQEGGSTSDILSHGSHDQATHSSNVTGSSLVNPRAPTNVGDDDPSAIPGLIQRLNRAMARLPPAGTLPDGEEELPPQYRER